MALYGFDGTGNVDQAKEQNDSNVVKFRDAYTNKKGLCYLTGVATRFGYIGSNCLKSQEF